MSCGEIVGEPLKVHSTARGTEYTERVADLLKVVASMPRWRTDFRMSSAGPAAAHWHRQGIGA